MEQLMMNGMQDGASAFDLILGGDPALYAIIRLSLTVSVSATLLASAIGLPLGALLGPLGFLGLRFTPQAMIFAQAVLVMPIVAALTRQTVEDLWVEYRDEL